MKKLILATVAVTALSIGGAYAQTRSDPVQGSGTAKGAEQLDPAGTKAMKKDNMVAPKPGMTTGMDSGRTGAMQREGSGSSPSSGATGGMSSGSGTRSGASDGDATGGK
jgi:hypothetical protein